MPFFITTMDLLLYLGMFIGSLVVLLKASDWFVDSAEEVGLSFGISPFIVGVTIVAFGTSLPELAASIASVFAGNSEIVIGNVVGSNIANILLIMGITAIIAKEIKLDFKVVDVDVPFLVGSAMFLWFACWDLKITWFETVIFLACLALFIVNSFNRDEKQDKSERPSTNWKTYAFMIGGIVLIFVSANYTIVAIQKLAEIAGISAEVIALTLVAFGTSLPEVAVSVAAARKGKTGIAVGNVVGSNIFNVLAVMGVSRLFGDLVIPPDVLTYSLPFMFAVTIMFSIISIGRNVSRWEGMMLVLFYIYFIGQIYQSALA